jgi:acyl-CoA thioesterase FadM
MESPPPRQGFEFCRTVHPGPEMIDPNGHLTIGYYAVLFEDAARAIWARYDLGQDYRIRTNHALYPTELHYSFKKEVFEGQAIDVYLRLVDMTDRALHAVFLMFHRADEDPATTLESAYLHVDLTARRAVPMEPKTKAALAELRAGQLQFPPKIGLGGHIDFERSSHRPRG